MMSTQLHSKSILDMPKRRNYYDTYIRLYRELTRIELELVRIEKECPEKTSCYLRYGAMFQEPYAPGEPHKGNIKITDDHKIIYEGIEKWQLVLADWYGKEANKLLCQREAILKKMYRLASKHYADGNVDSLSWNYPHLRKPDFGR